MTECRNSLQSGKDSNGSSILDKLFEMQYKHVVIPFKAGKTPTDFLFYTSNYKKFGVAEVVIPFKAGKTPTKNTILKVIAYILS